MAEEPDFMSTMRSTIEDASKMKSRMLERGVTAAKVKCPRCEGTIHGRLVGRRNHMRFWCDGDCQRQMME